jgi:SAM-dependent methyltransferase
MPRPEGGRGRAAARAGPRTTISWLAVPAPDPVPDGDAPGPSAGAAPSSDTAKLYGRWYYDTYTVPYDEQSEHWRQFFGGVADRIVAELAPKTALDAGCAKGFLVGALRERGVDAEGFDISEYAVSDVPEAARGHVRVGSLTEPIERRYDLVTCIEVIEHLDPADTAAGVAALCSASDAVLVSTTPGDRGEPTHVNVQPPERWSQLFALHGFFRDFRHDASYLSPWAALYRRGDRTIPELVLDYDRAWSELRTETIEQRRALLDMSARFEDLAGQGGSEVANLRAEVERLHEVLEGLNKEILRLRDVAIGKEAELATALGQKAEFEAMMGRYANLEQRLDEVLASTSWRVMWAAGAPVRKLRERKGQ